MIAETLVLNGTLEDKMLQRRKAMTAAEHQKAQKSLLDDTTMNDLIKNMDFLSFSAEELNSEQCRMAKLKQPQQIFARSYQQMKTAAGPQEAIDPQPTDALSRSRPRRPEKPRARFASDVTSPAPEKRVRLASPPPG